MPFKEGKGRKEKHVLSVPCAFLLLLLLPAVCPCGLQWPSQVISLVQFAEPLLQPTVFTLLVMDVPHFNMLYTPTPHTSPCVAAL